VLASFPKQLFAFEAGRQPCGLTAQFFSFRKEASFQGHRLLETTPFDDHRDHPVSHRLPMPFNDHRQHPASCSKLKRRRCRGMDVMGVLPALARRMEFFVRFAVVNPVY
jgi:hypothetical protein